MTKTEEIRLNKNNLTSYWGTKGNKKAIFIYKKYSTTLILFQRENLSFLRTQLLDISVFFLFL